MYKKIFYLLAIPYLLAITSCSDFLDLEPISSPTDQSFWNTEDDANSSTLAMYALLRQAFNYSDGKTFYAYGDLPSDEFATVISGEPWVSISNMNWSYSVSSSETTNALQRLRRYDIFYRVIDQANRVIQFVSEMPSSAFSSEVIRNKYVGEAYFIRAFTYFYMARIWGTVPIVTTSIDVVGAEDVPAASKEEVLAQVQADIEMAKSRLPWGATVASEKAIRANKGTLFALAAHYYAWRGEYQQCASAADSVIQHGSYSYVSRDSSTYHSIFAGQSAEGIFEIAQNGVDEGTSRGIGVSTLVEPYLRGVTTPGYQISPTSLNSLFDDVGDKRLRYAFDQSINESWAVCTKYGNISYTSETASAVPVFKNNIIVFRYSDIKLLRAEALAAIGHNAEAIANLNEVRSQADLVAWDNVGDLFEEIIKERGRELFLEGHRFYDLIRLARHNSNLLIPSSKMTLSQFNAGKYYWPFDPTLLSANKRLTQTSYWSSVNM